MQAARGRTAARGRGSRRPRGPDPVVGADLVNGEHAIVIFDLETTGLNHKHHRVIQLAAKVMGSNDDNGVFSSFVDPEGKKLSEKIRELTGITPEILAMSNARPFREVWPQFAAWLKSVGTDRKGIVMAAHNANFDHKFLAEEIARAGFSRFALAEVGVVSIVDTLEVLRDQALWRRSSAGADSDLPPRPGSFKLGELFKHLYGREEMPGAHSALGDVRGLERVLSAPGIRERWRLVASTSRNYQILVPAELEAGRRATPASDDSPAASRKRALPDEPRAPDKDEGEQIELEQSRVRTLRSNGRRGNA